MASEFEQGLMVGLLIGEGHFGGDGRQPQVTLRMHVRHEALFRWVERTFPGGRLYGPYHHDGRHYLQWMVRGTYLRDHFVPLLERTLSPRLDQHSWSRFDQMRRRYVRQLGALPEQGMPSATPPTLAETADSGAGALTPVDLERSKRAEEVFERMRRAQGVEPKDSEG